VKQEVVRQEDVVVIDVRRADVRGGQM